MLKQNMLFSNMFINKLTYETQQTHNTFGIKSKELLNQNMAEVSDEMQLRVIRALFFLSFNQGRGPNHREFHGPIYKPKYRRLGGTIGDQTTLRSHQCCMRKWLNRSSFLRYRLPGVDIENLTPDLLNHEDSIWYFQFLSDQMYPIRMDRRRPYQIRIPLQWLNWLITYLL